MSLASLEWGRVGSGRRLPFGGFVVDVPLLVLLLAIAGLGFVVLYSALSADLGLLMRQGLRFALGLAAFFVLAQVPPRYLRIFTPWLFFLGLGLLLVVMVEGEIGKGAQRWLDLGVLRFQPSEILKLAVPMTLAWFLALRPLPPNPLQLLVAGLLVALPVLLIAKQPDLGTALLVASAGATVLFLAGMGWRLIAGLGLIAAAAAPVLWMLMRPYQRQRVFTFLDPSSDPLGAGYHTIQAQIAIGSGGLFGKGWLHGTQSHLEFLPERSTDFIFAVIGEEFGLAGIALLLTIYLFIILRGLYVASQAQDSFGRLLAGSLTMVFFVYLFVNTGMVIGLLPVVGVPLPLISYGGTSLVTIMAGFGMIMSIHTHRKLLYV
jgi:rod shape determining protein RodA